MLRIVIILSVTYNKVNSLTHMNLDPKVETSWVRGDLL